MEEYLNELKTNNIVFVPFDELNDFLSFALENSVYVNGGAFDCSEENVMGQYLYI